MFTAACILATTVHAFADVTWDAVKKKVADGKSYTVSYKYDGPKGNFKFDYRTVVPGKIRSEIKESKSDSTRVGIVAVYDTAADKGQVFFKSGGSVINRNLTHKDVVDTPFATPVFSLVLNQIGSASAKAVSEGDKTRFEFNTGSGKYTVWANASGDITKTERIDNSAKSKEVREFTNLKWNNNPDCSMDAK
jgi:hypothetical protein